MRQLPTSIQEESASDGGTGRWWAWWSERMHLVLPIGVPASILLLFWANVIWTSIDQYLNPTSGAAVDVSPDPGIAEDVIATSVAVACGWFTFLVVRRFWGPVDRSAPWLAGVGRRRRFLGAAGIWAVGQALAIAFRAFVGEGSTGSPSVEGGWFSWDVVKPVLLAGLMEEVFFAGLAVLVGLRFRINLIVVIGISAILRGAIHLYQGWEFAVGAMLWGGFAVFAYYRYRSLLGLVVPHSIFNLGVAAGWMGQRWLVVAVAVVVVGFAVVYIAEIERSRGSRLGTEGGVNVGDRQSRSVVLTGEP